MNFNGTEYKTKLIAEVSRFTLQPAGLVVGARNEAQALHTLENECLLEFVP